MMHINGMRKRIMIDLIIVVPAAYVLLCVFLRWREPSMIYHPFRRLEATPDAAGLSYEDVFLTTADGVRIHGWFLPALRSPITDHRSPITILFLHGNAGNISDRIDTLAVLHQLGAGILIIDYRGYGRSEGQPNEPGTYRDAQAAYDYLLQQRGVRPQNLVLYGESLGTAVAVDLASKHHVGGVVLQEPFTSVGDVGKSMFPVFPVRWLVRNKYDSLSKIGRINAPLLIFHSRNDEVFPFSHAERLFAAAHDPKRLVELRGGHNDAFFTSMDTCRAALKEFLGRLGET
jgi:fermentation-respiration switch protein FrsA (DUF1100 family)